MKNIFNLLLFIFPIIATQGQIVISNSSFEDEPQDATVPQGWLACEDGTTPDILPGYWGVSLPAEDGDTYVGLITRSDGSFESIGQRFSQRLEKDECYQFSLSLSHSKMYSGYNGPLKLRIWISNKKCGKDQLVYESPTISHNQWKNYSVDFQAEGNFKYIIFEAFKTEEPFSYQGNILLDNISPIKRCSRVSL